MKLFLDFVHETPILETIHKELFEKPVNYLVFLAVFIVVFLYFLVAIIGVIVFSLCLAVKSDDINYCTDNLYE